MARGRGQGPRRQVKGFRPGKEPPELRKRQARQQFGDLSPAQQRLVEVFAERTPEEARALLRRQRNGLLAGALLVTILAIALFFWSAIAGAIAAVGAAVLFFLWWRLHQQREAYEAMVDAVSGPVGKKRRRG